MDTSCQHHHDFESQPGYGIDSLSYGISYRMFRNTDVIHKISFRNVLRSFLEQSVGTVHIRSYRRRFLQVKSNSYIRI